MGLFGQSVGAVGGLFGAQAGNHGARTSRTEIRTRDGERPVVLAWILFFRRNLRGIATKFVGKCKGYKPVEVRDRCCVSENDVLGSCAAPACCPCYRRVGVVTIRSARSPNTILLFRQSRPPPLSAAWRVLRLIATIVGKTKLENCQTYAEFNFKLGNRYNWVDM